MSSLQTASEIAATRPLPSPIETAQALAASGAPGSLRTAAALRNDYLTERREAEIALVNSGLVADLVEAHRVIDYRERREQGAALTAVEAAHLDAVLAAQSALARREAANAAAAEQHQRRASLETAVSSYRQALEIDRGHVSRLRADLAYLRDNFTIGNAGLIVANLNRYGAELVGAETMIAFLTNTVLPKTEAALAAAEKDLADYTARLTAS